MKTIVLSFVLASAAVQSASASSTDPVTALIRQQTDLTSNAGQAGDQATVDRLTSDLVLFSAGDGAVQRDDKFDVDDGVTRQLRTWTEARHQGASAGNPRAIAQALFVDERGALNTQRDFSGGRATVSEFVVHHTATVAVSSFKLETGGKQFLSVEIWSLKGQTFRLVAGQTIALHQDPPSLALSAATLHSYAGVYSAGPGSTVVISATKDGLTSTAAGGKPRVLQPEAQDTFFTPGLAAGYLRQPVQFELDRVGQVSGYRSNGIAFKKIDGASVAAGPAPESGPLKLRDFRVRHVGDVAVAAFFHDRDTSYYGQVLHQTFQSMEAWVNEGGTWKMISSQGCQI